MIIRRTEQSDKSSSTKRSGDEEHVNKMVRCEIRESRRRMAFGAKRQLK